MKILLDMNLSPDWVGVLAKYDISVVHWSTVGDPRAEDTEIIDWVCLFSMSLTIIAKLKALVIKFYLKY